MLILGHRGVAGLLPENSAAGFEEAVRLGLDGVEFDVRPDAGGRPVVCHDPDLKRLFGIPERIENLGARTLKRLTAGPRQLLTLDEALEILAPLPFIDIEIKAEDARPRGIEQAVASAIARHGLRNKTLFTSFNPLTLARLKRLYPPAKTGFLLDPRSPMWMRAPPVPKAIGCEAVAPNCNWVGELANSVWKRWRLKRLGWTVNTREQFEKMVRYDMDAVISDNPVQIREMAGAIGSV